MGSERKQILSADIVDDGLLVAFNDGRWAIYSTELLLSVLSQAKPVAPDEDDDLPL